MNAADRIACAFAHIPAEDQPFAENLFMQVVAKIKAGQPQMEIEDYISREIERHRSERPCAARD
ncbi:hypothetical protein ACW9UR_13750 [Halovulum sp. GXIMD14794]